MAFKRFPRQENIHFPVQLTTSRIGNLTRLILLSLYVCDDHTLYMLYIYILGRTVSAISTPAGIGRNPVSKHQIQPEYGDDMSRLTRDGTAEPVSRDQILRRKRGQGNIYFPCPAHHEPDWQPYPVGPSLAICDDHTYTVQARR